MYFLEVRDTVSSKNVNIKGQYTVQNVTIKNYNASHFKSNVKPGSRKSVDVLSNGNFFDR